MCHVLDIVVCMHYESFFTGHDPVCTALDDDDIVYVFSVREALISTVHEDKFSLNAAD